MTKKIMVGVILITFLIFITYGAYRMFKRNQISLKEESELMISSSEKDITVIAQIWMDTYLKQYQQKELYTFEKITDFKIQEIQVLDIQKNIVQIDFEAYKKRRYTNYFRKMDWGIEEKKKITGQWVLYFEEKNNQYLVKGRQRLAAYQLMKGNETHEFEKEQEEIKKQNNLEKQGTYTYKIEKGILYLSYDNKKTWIPVDSKNTPDTGYSPYLTDGYYQISREVTILADKKNVWYSNDAGKTFKNIYQKQEPTIHHVYFIDKNIGFIINITGNALGGVIGIEIEKTVDGGGTWEKVSNGPGVLHTSSTYLFINEQIGFICDTNTAFTSGTLYRTQDGFQTFTPVSFEEGTIDSGVTNLTWNEIYDTPQIPTKHGSILRVYVGGGVDGDYKGGVFVLYESDDNGKTWILKKEVNREELEEG